MPCERRLSRTRRGDARRSALRSLSLAACLLASAGARAQDQAELRASARRLAIDGMDLADRGDCKGALLLLAKAEALYHAPVHLQYIARCEARLGHLVVATETWRTLGREKLSPDAPPIFREAVAEASREIERLEPRLATLVLDGLGSYASVAIDLDGRPVPAAALGAPLVVDPGSHLLRVQAPGHEPWEQKLDVAEGGKRHVAVTLKDAAPAVTAPTPQPASSPTTAADVPRTSHGAATARAAGIGLLTLGGGALVAGGITWGIRNADRNELRQKCPATECEFDPEADKSRIQTLTSVTNVLLFGGATLVASGAVVLWLSAKHEPSSVAIAGGATPDGALVSVRAGFR